MRSQQGYYLERDPPIPYGYSLQKRLFGAGSGIPAMNSLNNLTSALEGMNNEIIIDEATRKKVILPLLKMLSFNKKPGESQPH